MIFSYGGKSRATGGQYIGANFGALTKPLHFSMTGTIIYATNPNLRNLWIRLYDKNNTLQKCFETKVNVRWEYNRKGGCGQAEVTLLTPDDSLIESIQPESRVEIYIDRTLRYSGKMIRISRSIGSGSESISLTFYGYLIELNTLIVQASYTGMAVGAIVKDILDNYVVPYSNITYESADIDDTDYAVASISFNHTVNDAISLLAELGGNIEWGVDRDKNFFFKETDPNIRRVYVLGKDVTSYQMERQDDGIINVLNVYGQDSSEPLVTASSELSIAKFGRKTANLFESAISTVADASRLALVNLKNSTSQKRNSKFTVIKNDDFIEQTVPIGATTVNKSNFSRATKYGTNAKYGRNIKYGKLRRDQLTNIVYNFTNGGFSIEANITGDVPNLGDYQKRIENEIKNLQRR